MCATCSRESLIKSNLKKRKTRREKFLEQMDGLISWKQLESKIRRYYPKDGNGRKPYPLSVMMRIHCLQLFYNLSDPAMEDVLYEIEPMRRFAGRLLGVKRNAYAQIAAQTDRSRLEPELRQNANKNT